MLTCAHSITPCKLSCLCLAACAAAGDDKGLVLPPRVAAKQAVIIPIPKATSSPEAVEAMLQQVRSSPVCVLLYCCAVLSHLSECETKAYHPPHNHPPFLPLWCLSALLQALAFRTQLEAAGVRAETDMRTNYTPGWKYNHWELRGVPVSLDLLD